MPSGQGEKSSKWNERRMREWMGDRWEENKRRGQETREKERGVGTQVKVSFFLPLIRSPATFPVLFRREEKKERDEYLKEKKKRSGSSSWWWFSQARSRRSCYNSLSFSLLFPLLFYAFWWCWRPWFTVFLSLISFLFFSYFWIIYESWEVSGKTNNVKGDAIGTSY